MKHDPLLSDDLATLLHAFPSDALEGIVNICKRHGSWSPFPQDRAYRAHRLAAGADFKPHVNRIAREVLWWGSHEFWRLGGVTADWRGVVLSVADKVGVSDEDQRSELPVWKVEQAILKKILSDWEKLTPAQREAAMKKAGIDVGAAPGGAAAAVGGLALLGGEELLAFLAIRGALAFAAGALAAIGAVVGVFGAAYSLAGPSQRVIRPVVLMVAYTRQKLRDERAAAAFGE